MLGCPTCSNCNWDVYTYFGILGTQVLLGLICHALTDILIDIFLLPPHSSYQPGWPPFLPPSSPPLPHGHNKGSRATGEFLCIDFSGFKVQRNKDKRGGIPQPKYSYLSICFASQALQKVFLRELLFSNIWELVVSTQCRGKRDDKFLVQWR